MFESSILLLLVINGCSAFMVDSCKTSPKLMMSFDLEKFQGTWYEVYRYKPDFESHETCARIRVEVVNDGQIKIVLMGNLYGTRVNSTIMRGYVPDPIKEPSKLALKNLHTTVYSNYWVLDTDYDNYAFMYECVADNPSVWIFSKHRHMTEETNNILIEHGIKNALSTNEFVREKQIDCPN